MSEQPKTFVHQMRLPRLPVPALEETAARYLRSLRPFVSQEEYEHNEALMTDFISPNGLGQRLQQRLLDVNKVAPHNWLNDTFWTRKAYHEWREPLVVNSNWYLLFIDDPSTPKEYLTVDNGVRPAGRFSEFQIKRTAHLIYKLLEFKELLDSERLPPESTRAYPLCMYQYRRCYGVTRIPQHGCDAFPHCPHPAPYRHVLIIVRDQFYVLDGYSTEGLRLTAGDIERQLAQIISDVERIAPDTSKGTAGDLDLPVGVLTADHRDHWAVAREHLLSLSPKNYETLTRIEDALFAISLDDYATGMDLDQWSRNVFHGVNSHNRWLDKAMSIIVESNGRAGMNGEHSPCDALIPSNIVDYIVAEPTSLDAQRSSLAIPPPQRIRFVTNEETRKYIMDAEERIARLIADSDPTVLQFSDYGVHLMKKTAKCSPDAYMQMALQLAYYTLHGKVVATYETGSTRQFQHGRTDTIRTCSIESKAFVEGMTNHKLTVQEKYNLLITATTAHTAYTRDASNGKGCDRHLFGLRLLMQKGESHPLFAEPAFFKSQTWLLSTSGLSAGNRFSGTGFGAVEPNGYGINYLTGEHLLKFGIESKKSSLETDSKAFKENLVKALRDMRAVCETVNGKYETNGKL